MSSEKARKKIRGVYAIVDSSFTGKYTPLDLAAIYLEAGCPVIQWRDKNRALSAENFRIFAKTAEGFMKLRSRYQFMFILNDDVSLARELGADGVHIGANDLPLVEARKQVGEDFLVGYSSHSIGEAVQAFSDGASYVAFGAVFQTQTKGPGHPVQGLERLCELVRECDEGPLVAIGGICRENFRVVVESGVSAVAMITALSLAENPGKELRWFCETFRQNSPHHCRV